MVIPIEIFERLCEFRDQNGVQWLSKLQELWMAGEDQFDPLLRMARNVIGPSGLDRVKLDPYPRKR